MLWWETQAQGWGGVRDDAVQPTDATCQNIERKIWTVAWQESAVILCSQQTPHAVLIGKNVERKSGPVQGSRIGGYQARQDSPAEPAPALGCRGCPVVHVGCGWKSAGSGRCFAPQGVSDLAVTLKGSSPTVEHSAQSAKTPIFIPRVKTHQ